MVPYLKTAQLLLLSANCDKERNELLFVRKIYVGENGMKIQAAINKLKD